jgi:GTP-binding protein
MFNYNKTRFLKSSTRVLQFPADIGAEVAFVGRSNVGKSSALNALTRQKHLAKTSKTPGRTHCINFFSIDSQNRLVDLPGYGYAEVSKALRDSWHKLLDQYLRERKSLKGLILLMDIRHPLQTFEKNMLNWADQIELPVHILLTKSDKLSKNACFTVYKRIQNALDEMGYDDLTVSVFSAKQNVGLEVLQQKINSWLETA